MTTIDSVLHSGYCDVAVTGDMTMTTNTINRLARAHALEHELQKKGDTPRAARLADKVFGVADGYPRWNWASLYYRTALLTGSWT